LQSNRPRDQLDTDADGKATPAIPDDDNDGKRDDRDTAG